jgi:CRP-like cAMP-binding protein
MKRDSVVHVSITERFLRGRGREILDPAELAALEDAVAPPVAVRARSILVRRGEPVTKSTLLVSGFACRYMDDRSGRRQLVAIHVPGDLIDLHGFPMRVLDHDLVTLTDVAVATVDHRQLESITERFPRLTRMLWFATLLEAAMHREWIFRLGRLPADGRVAHLFCELDERLRLVGLVQDDRFALPITQADVGEACGLTGVHVNRVLRRLREGGLMTFGGGEAVILDRAALRHAAEFSPDYLYAGGDWRARDA